MDVLTVSPAVQRLLLDLVAKDTERSTQDSAENPAHSSEAGDAVCPGPSQDADGPSVTKKRRHATCDWTPGETKLLLDRYSNYFPQVGPMKKFKNKKCMFAKIAQDIKDVTGSIWTGDQCCTRYKTVCKRKKSACVQNSQSGNSPQLVEYEDELEKIRHLDDSLEPEVVRDSAGVVSQKTSSQPSPASSQSESTDNSSSLSGSCEQKDDDHQKKRKRQEREHQPRAPHEGFPRQNSRN
ncbi:uncharacterized protein LOC125940682 [Dermacentor silvarum]|uniref:uncharacterized protein LOC125940682 n=1 Tax=Dermacentor silvarum TaxID=543639 RepID=UPI002101B83A|nr:uncharacterized protein LOC125940682 [Dermacentor silvarum]